MDRETKSVKKRDMNKMLTAEELLQDSFTISHFYSDKYGKMMCFSDDVQRAMIEFAKYHVEAALKEASKTKRVDLYVRPDIKGTKYKLVSPGESYDILGTKQMWKVNKDSILNSYPLENIK